MSSGWTEVVITTVAGLVATEVFDVAPWVARRIVPVAARLWTSNRDQAAIYAEEWCDILDERPGKLFKLLTSLGFLAGAVLLSLWGFAAIFVLPLLAMVVATLDTPARQPQARHLAPSRFAAAVE